jgi:hypothetical protein
LIIIKTYLGEIFSGPTWEDVLVQLKAMNFSQPRDLRELMDGIAKRIKISQGEVIQYGDYSDFGRELERVGFLEIVQSE